MIRSIADIERLEQIPLERHIDAWTVDRLLARGAMRDPRKFALHYLPHGDIDEPSEDWSYARLHDEVRSAARLFRASGVGANDVVAILLPNVPQNYVALLGAATAGIAFPINWMLSPALIAELMRAARPKLVVALGPTPGYDIHEKCAAIRDQQSGVHWLEVKGPGGLTASTVDFDAQCASAAAGAPSEIAPRPEADAFYIHTGGTTSAPKIARITHRNVAYKCWAISTARAIEPSEIVFAASPLFHVGGIVLRTINVLASGQTSVIPGPLGFRNRSMLANYWRFVERFGITELAGVPTTLGALTSIPVGEADISSLGPYASTGASALPLEVAGYFERNFGIRIGADYGMTETTASVSAIPKVPEAKPGSSGLRLPFTEIRIVAFGREGEIVRDCGVDEIGEIIVRGAGVIPGYLDSALDRKLFVEQDWVRTADLGRIDADGYLWVTGRAKDLIIRSGHNIDPAVIEDALLGHDAVALAAAVSKPDAYAGELPVAYVQLKAGRSVTIDELSDFARARIPERAAVPVEIFVVEQLPVTAVGKIVKQQLRDETACRTIGRLLSASLPPDSVQQVAVTQDPLHGTLIVLDIDACENSDLVARIAEVFAPLSQRYTVRWLRQAGRR